jgi:hypothetical protein
MTNSLENIQNIDELIAKYFGLGQELNARLGLIDCYRRTNSLIDMQIAIKNQSHAIARFLNPEAPPPVKVGDSAVVSFCEIGPRGDLFIASRGTGTILAIDDDGIEVRTPEKKISERTIGALWGGKGIRVGRRRERSCVAERPLRCDPFVGEIASVCCLDLE